MGRDAPDFGAFGATMFLGFVVIPVWLAMGLSDYICHRASDIARTSGAKESLLHLMQFASVGIPLITALFFDIDAGLLVLMTVFVVLRHLIAFVDVRYANATRKVRPVEQMVHSFLEIMPITALLLAGVIAFRQLEALFGLGEQHADFVLHLRQPPLPAWYIGSVLLAAFLLNFVPYLEELLRCLRARPER
ncbi:MAG: diguanylate cyclase [Alphaproteobacteria bacterium]|nr:diguanylate cyclase [Alphaproteobacteria bacterium]